MIHSQTRALLDNSLRLRMFRSGNARAVLEIDTMDIEMQKTLGRDADLILTIMFETLFSNDLKTETTGAAA